MSNHKAYHDKMKRKQTLFATMSHEINKFIDAVKEAEDERQEQYDIIHNAKIDIKILNGELRKKRNALQKYRDKYVPSAEFLEKKEKVYIRVWRKQWYLHPERAHVKHSLFADQTPSFYNNGEPKRVFMDVNTKECYEYNPPHNLISNILDVKLELPVVHLKLNTTYKVHSLEFWDQYDSGGGMGPGESIHRGTLYALNVDNAKFFNFSGLGVQGQNGWAGRWSETTTRVSFTNIDEFKRLIDANVVLDRRDDVCANCRKRKR